MKYCQHSLEQLEKNGDLMKRQTFNATKYALSRFLKEVYNVNIHDQQYPKTQMVFKNVTILLKRKSKGYTNHYDQIPDDDLASFFRQVDVNNAQQLQWYVFVLIQIHFCKRGTENIAYYTKDTFSITCDIDGVEYIYQQTDELTKNSRENTTEKVPKGRIYQHKEWDNKCPVACFRKYISKLSPNPRLWQKIRLNYSANDTTWFVNQPLGVNSVGKFMKTISAFFNFSKIFTNHSLRVSSISILGRNFEENDIKTISGHTSSSSLGIYKRVDECKKRRMADTLSTVFNPTQQKPIEDVKQRNETVTAVNESIVSMAPKYLNDNSCDMPILIPQSYDNEDMDNILTRPPHELSITTATNNIPSNSFAPVIQHCTNCVININYNK